jgi:hypothetical protein
LKKKKTSSGPQVSPLLSTYRPTIQHKRPIKAPWDFKNLQEFSNKNIKNLYAKGRISPQIKLKQGEGTF